jgi:hypothetical protein
MRSEAKSVDEYLATLPEERRAVIAAVRKMILRALPKGYEERMNWGMLSYEIPLARYPNTYNKQPLAYVALAAQKNNYSLYLMGVYSDSAQEKKLRQSFADAGKKLDMGKSCIRFKAVDDLPLKAVGEVIASMPVDEYLANYERVRAGTQTGRGAATKKPAAKASKPVAKKTK